MLTTSHTPVTSPVLRKLRSADNVELVGVTQGANPWAVYWTAVIDPTGAAADVWALEAAPIWGGADPVIIASGLDDDDPAVVSGGAAAWWVTPTEGDLSANSIGIWTPETGPKTLTSPSYAGIFAASNDGSIVAYAAEATTASTPIFVTPSSAPTTKNPLFSGSNVLNLTTTASNCAPSMTFAQSRLAISYCTGSDADQSTMTFFTVDNGVVAERIQSADLMGWTVDASGNNYFFQDDTTGEGTFVRIGDEGTSATSLGNVDQGAILGNGVVVAIKGSNLYTYTPDLQKTLIGNATQLLFAAPDDKTLAFATQNSGLSLVDIKVVDTSEATPHVVSIVDDASAEMNGFTGDSQRVIYRTGIQTTGSGIDHGALKSKPTAGGTELALADDSYFASAALAGTGLVSTSASQLSGVELLSETFGYVDAAKGGAASNVSSILRYTQGIWFDRTYVYEDLGPNGGIFALEVP